MKKYESDYFFNKTNDIFVVRWMDNTEVTIATNYDTVEPKSVCNVIPEKKEKGWRSNSHTYSTPTTDAWAAAIYTTMGPLIIEYVLEAKSGGDL